VAFANFVNATLNAEVGGADAFVGKRLRLASITSIRRSRIRHDVAQRGHGTKLAFVTTPGVNLWKPEFNQREDEPAMRIYDIEFDIDSFLDEMEEMQRVRRQQQRERQQQIHRSSDVGPNFTEPALEHETE
jgi:hypothetical protein